MNRERVQMLRDMMAGIPSANINLNVVIVDQVTGRWLKQERAEPSCGIVACIGGWAALYPPFVEMGILDTTWEKFFDLSSIAFSPRHLMESGTHKQIALKRLDALLK